MKSTLQTYNVRCTTNPIRFRRVGLLVLGWCVVIWGMTSCEFRAQPPENKKVIAEVDNVYLLESELTALIHPAASKEDSLSLANSYVNQWINDQVLKREAEKYFSSDFEIERLVNEYRSTLLKHKFENKILQERFDTTITDAEREAFYLKNQAQFVLHEPIAQIWLVQMHKKHKQTSKIKSLLAKGNRADILQFIDQSAVAGSVDSTLWYNTQHLSNWHPDFDVKGSKNQIESDSLYEYFLKIVEYRADKEIAPLSYVRKQIDKMILYQRKRRILSDLQKELYEEALNDNIIKLAE